VTPSVLPITVTCVSEGEHNSVSNSWGSKTGLGAEPCPC